MIEAGRTSAVVLAAGSSSRFGSPKALAPLWGRPLLQHLLDAVATLGFAEVVVVLGRDAREIEEGLLWRNERVVRNPYPDAGLSSSLQLGLASLGAGSEAALIFLGDQPAVGADVVRRLLEGLESPARPIAAPRYQGGGGPNPLLVHRAAWSLALEATGDRGLGPVLRQHPELVCEVAVPGSNPDVDTPEDLAALEARPSPYRKGGVEELRLASLPNLRDVGGHETRGGRRMRTGLLFRSASLDRLSEADAARLGALGVRTVFDLRTAPERDQGPDRLPPGTRYIVLDVLDGMEIHNPAEIMEFMRDSRLAREKLGDGQGKAMFMAQYRGFVASEGARRAYRSLFLELTRESCRPALMHCTGGKDRTGWAAASLQLFLGVPDEAVMADFMATNESFGPRFDAFHKDLESRGIDPAIIDAFMWATPDYLEATLTEMRSVYGSIEAYFSDGLGLDAKTLKELRTVFLE